jgi:GntR family transcriptional regulator, transcriptional repressor for pyruvate dehydrogenase complex
VPTAAPAPVRSTNRRRLRTVRRVIGSMLRVPILDLPECVYSYTSAAERALDGLAQRSPLVYDPQTRTQMAIPSLGAVHFDTIKQPKAAQRVAERIRSAIRAGELHDGDRLPPERALIEQFGYSRAIVREALRMLEEEGLISLHAGRNGGAVIRTPGAERLVNAFDMLLRLQMTTQEDFYEARRLLEPILTKLAIERATPDDVAALRRCLEPPYDRHNRFHRTLAEAAHNNVLSVVMHIIMELCMRQLKTDEFEPVHLTEVHGAIIDAIEARDEATATARIVQHLHHSETEALEVRRKPRKRKPSVT